MNLLMRPGGCITSHHATKIAGSQENRINDGAVFHFATSTGSCDVAIDDKEAAWRAANLDAIRIMSALKAGFLGDGCLEIAFISMASRWCVSLTSFPIALSYQELS